MSQDRQPVASGSGPSAYGSYPRSDWSTASAAIKRPHQHSTRGSTRGTRGSQSQQLTTFDPNAPKVYSRLKQQVLTEEEYLTGLEDVILRDFFPQLATLTAQDEYTNAVEREDEAEIERSMRRMRDLCTPAAKRRARGQTPGRTPYSSNPSATPAYFGATPSSTRSTRSRLTTGAPATRYDGSLSLNEFQARYTSEDNSDFGDILAKDNEARREKNAWAFKAEERANQKVIRGREARERLVDVTRKMVESSKDGTVLMIDGGAGRPGERKLVVEGIDVGEGRGLMVEGKRGEEGRLLITSGEKTTRDEVREAQVALTTLDKDRKGKQKEEQYVDWDKNTAEEDEENKQPAVAELQAPVEGWPFTARNSLYFPPDANITNQADVLELAKVPKTEGLSKGEPKAIRYHATRLEEMNRRPSDAPSPTRSKINAAISGTPYHGARVSKSPKVGGFSFVDALPTPRAGAGGAIDAQGLQELMTWGTITKTPVRSGSTAAAALKRNALGDGGGPFGIAPTPKREELAHKLANRARKNMGKTSQSLRKSALEGSIRGGSTPRSPFSPSGASPRSTLSPAAQSLLSKTGQGKALGSGLAQSPGWAQKEREREREERLRRRTRELESRERIRRERWSPSPVPSEVRDPLDDLGERAMKGVHHRRDD